jgi:hypothetical protein
MIAVRFFFADVNFPEGLDFKRDGLQAIREHFSYG